ncbi:MAG: aromatic amino acid transport family protein [Patescibacteria group bacterium]|nr:aromatic amino acid transport family protein [Patescibacteria group bacterium]
MNHIDHPVVLHRGVYKKTATTSEAVFMITGMTIGAGILGLPYVIARSGLAVGLMMILLWGLVMLLLNLMLGDIAVRTKESFQLPGFAGKYVGPWAKYLLSAVIIFSGFGTLLAYIIGEGQVLAEIFGGLPFWWSVFFWSIASFFVWMGLQTVKSAERILSLSVIILIIGLAIFLLPKMSTANLVQIDFANFFLPFGVILFAMHATPSIAEAHALLPGSERRFKKAIIFGTLIPVFVYTVFALAVVGFSGLSTTELATIGLGRALGPVVSLIANAFAVLAMGTCFMGMGLALKQSLMWDHKVSRHLAEITVITVPLLLFLFGFRSFVEVLDVVGGLFIGIEALLIVLICYQARKKGALGASRYGFNYFWLAAIPVLILFLVATIYSVFKMF